MRNSLWLSAAIGLTLGGTAAAEVPAKKPAALPRLTADAVVQHHLEALGGAEAMRATTTMSFTATEKRADGTTVVKNVERARPNLVRVEVTEGNSVTVKAFDGRQGWVMKDGKAEIMPAEGSSHMAAWAQFDDALLDYAQHGVQVKLLGLEQLAGGKAYKLQVTMASGDSELRWIDATTWFEVQRSVTYVEDGKSVTSTIGFGDYRRVDGQMVNHSVTWDADGKHGATVISNVSLSKAIAQARFAVPAGAVPMKIEAANKTAAAK